MLSLLAKQYIMWLMAVLTNFYPSPKFAIPGKCKGSSILPYCAQVYIIIYLSHSLLYNLSSWYIVIK